MLVVLLALGAGPLAGSAAAVPNVLVFVTDDQRLDGTMAVMPKTKQWFLTGGSDVAGPFQGGAFFPKGVANTPWCCPARASILTGQYSHNHGLTDLDGPSFGTTEAAPKQQQTIAAYLRNATPSYRTGIFGKYLNGWDIQCTPRSPGNPADPPPFFDEYAIFNSGYAPACVNENGSEKQLWRYSTKYVTEQVLDFLDSAGSQPWFLYVTPYAGHEPFLPETNYIDAPVPALTETSAFFESDRTDKPAWLREQEITYDAGWNREKWRDYLRTLKSADDMVDAVMRKVRALGQDEDTIAFFTSDNGFMWGDHGGLGKANPYRASVQVPFFMRWPGWLGHSGNETDNRLVGHVDIAPTVLDVAGVTPAGGDLKDGRTLLDVSNPRKRILTELAGGFSRAGRWSSITTADLHYTETYGTNTDGTTDYSNVVFREYYDLTRDPLELRNLLADADPRNDPPTQELAAAVAADRVCAGSTCPRGGEEVPLEAQITRGAAEDVFSAGSSTDDPATSGFLEGDFHFTSNEPRSLFECRLEALNGQYGGHNWHSCWSPTTYSPFVNGPYRFSVRAIDPGNATRTSPIETYEWTVAATANPETRIGVLTPPPRASSQTAWFSFSSSKPASTFRCKLDASPVYVPCSTPASFTVQDTLANAPHELRVVAVTADGEDPTPALFRWSVDSTPLTVSGFTAVTPSHKREAKFSFDYTRSAQSSEAGDLPSRFECKLDGGQYEPCGIPNGASWSRTYPGLATGNHILSVRVLDQVGNVSAPVTHQWTVGDAHSFQAVPDTRWPDVVGTEVRSVVPDGCGGWYVGGTFTGVGSNTGYSNLAHIVGNKAVDTAWVPIVTGGGIRTMVLSGDKRTLYIGGAFTAVNAVGRNRLAAVTTPLSSACGPAAGNAVTGWNPDASNTVFALAFGAAGGGESVIYAAGAFSYLNGGTVTRRKLAKLMTTDTGTVVGSWDANVNNAATLYALTTFRESVYVGGAGMTTIGGAARNNLAEIDSTTAQATSWNPNPNGTVQSIEHRRRALVDDVSAADQLPTLFVGGSFTQIGNPAKSRPGAAEIGASEDGGATPWNPAVVGGAAAYEFLPITTYNTILGGSFEAVAQGAKLAETDRFTGAALGWNPNPNKGVFDLEYNDPVLAVGGLFDSVGPGTPLPRRLLAFYCRTDAPTASGPCS